MGHRIGRATTSCGVPTSSGVNIVWGIGVDAKNIVWGTTADSYLEELVGERAALFDVSGLGTSTTTRRRSRICSCHHRHRLHH